MKVSEVMTKGVECIPPDDTVQEAARKMREFDVGAIPVCENNRLGGMITDRDIAVRCVAEGCDPKTTKVKEVRTPGTVYCFEDQNIEEAAGMMRERKIRRLVVLDRNKRLVGIVSLGDLAVQTHDEHLTSETLERVSEPVHS